MESSSAIADALLDAAPDAIVVASRGGRIVRVNRAAAALFGYTRDELLALSVTELVPQGARAAHGAHVDRYESDPRMRPMGVGTGALVACTKDGREVPVEISLSPVATADGQLVIAIVRDVTERRALEERLRFLSTRDVLTGLFNRNFFEEELARVQRGRAPPGGVLVCDVDGLKRVNDTLGHAAGDELIRRSASVLVATFRGDDVVARIGGDEFAVLFYGADALHGDVVVRRLRAQLEAHNAEIAGPELALSMGYAVVERDDSLAEALRRADAALYAEKRSRPPSRQR